MEETFSFNDLDDDGEPTVIECYVVTNTGDTAITGISVGDDDGTALTVGSLAPGALLRRKIDVHLASVIK